MAVPEPPPLEKAPLPWKPASPGTGPSAVPDLVTDYQHQLDALRHQAKDLARMRADVLSAAERESQTIVGNARSDIRDILVRARRELLVLAAQVQAVTERDELPGLGRADADAGAPTTDRLRGAASDARQEVRHVLTEARPDIDALTAEARVLRANLLALHAPHAAPSRGPDAPPDIDVPRPSGAGATPAARTAHEEAARESSADATITADTLFTPDSSAASTPTSEAPSPLVADGAIPSFRSTPRQSTGRVFVATFAALAVVIAVATVWWMRTGPAAPVSQTTASSAPPASAPVLAPASAAAETPEPGPPGAPTPVEKTLTIEARQTSWIRAQVDGRPDAGRIFAAGETTTITGASRVSIRAGDAGAVFVTVNGGEPEALGAAGRPLTRDIVLDDAPATRPSPSEADKPQPLQPAERPVGPQGAARAEPPAATGPIESVAARPPSGPPTTSMHQAPPPVAASAPARPPEVMAAPVAQSVPAASVAPAPGEEELESLSQRWLDAYLAGNASTMLTLAGGTPDVRDQRSPVDRLASAAGAYRSFETPRLQRGADIGVFSVRMTERAAGGESPRDRVALVSQVWMRRTGKWQLIDVRIASEAQVK